MPVGEPEPGEGPVNLRPGEREIHGGISPARQAQQGERSAAGTRKRSLTLP